MNNHIIHVDPQITQYTVYITDNHTGYSIVEKNVTRTQFTIGISENVLSPIYQISAWNAVGEGELSEPVHGCIPRSKLYICWSHFQLLSRTPVCVSYQGSGKEIIVICLLNDMAKLYFLSAVPRKIAGENVVLTAASNILHINLHVSSH